MWERGGWVAGFWLMLIPLAAALLAAWIRRTGSPSQPLRERYPSATGILDVTNARSEIDALDVVEGQPGPARCRHGS